jgi:hypothetical protein
VERIRDTLIAVMQGLTEKGSAAKPDAQVALKKSLTKKELEHIKLNYFKKGVVHLSVDSSSWLYRFSLKKEDLLLRLSRVSPEIKDIRFRIGEVK